MKPWRLPAGVRLRVPLRLRVLFRGVFALLALALLALALSVLQDEKLRSLRVYAEGLKKNQAQIAARLRHPTGQLALLNPGAADRPAQPLRPLVLPYRALDFSDRLKAQQAVEMAGCALQFPDGATLCAAVGNSPYGGAFVYLVASLAAGELQPHASGDLAMDGVHRAVVDLAWRDSRQRWTAPYELDARGNGRLTGYAGDAPVAFGAKTVRDFEGWLWQEGRCLDAQATLPGCARRSFVSLRLPVEVFRDALRSPNPVWPPPDLDRMALRLRLLGPGSAAVLFDSDRPGATLPFSMQELRTLLLPGEKLTVQRVGAPAPLFMLTGASASDEPIAPWIAQLIRRLPVEGFDAPLSARETVDTALGRFDLSLAGDIRSVNQALAAVATRLAWTVGAMLLAVGATWGVIELFVIRRITLLTRRAAAVSRGVRQDGGQGAGLDTLDLSDLRGGDELGVLAQGLKDLLQRVNDDMQREQIRVRQEKDTWHAVGHEIMSPLQSLLALHGGAGDPAARYLQRMQQAVRVLYGQASPSEAFAATTLQPAPLDLDAFLAQVAANAGHIDIHELRYSARAAPLMVRADEHSLEDVVTHLLRNAQRHRTPGTPITLALTVEGGNAVVTLHNHGEAIPDDLLGRIFDYGVSGASPAGTEGSGDASRRGQGLFVARTYMAKMGGTIAAANGADGVVFTLVLPLA
ncbi:signal transduction histidine kinase [Burkholderiales bacterium JOSHI_001]|nr:signal transduction histidine kinase [Burkholderiales bacterium JOSHI_001]